VKYPNQRAASLQQGPAVTPSADWRLCIEAIGDAKKFSGSVDLYWREDAVRLIEFLKQTAGKDMVSVILRGPDQTVEVFR
jgi:hypothetical protein